MSLAEIAEEQRDLEARLAAWLKKVAVYDRSGDWSADGYATPASALRHACQMDQGVARKHIELARKLEDLPVVADAFGRGEISARHAVVVANAYTPERAEHIANVEPQLVAAAREHTPNQLGNVVRYLIDAIDGDGGAVSDEALFERRRLHLSSTLDGMLAINGLCDPASAEILLAAVNAEMAQDHHNLDGRLPAQRRMDALTNLGRRSLDRGELGESRNVRPHVTVVVDLDELPSSTPELVAKVRTEHRHNGHLSRATLERLTCDCDISRVITTGRSEVLDVGRATRTIPPATWKALVVRDQHCQTPDATDPPTRVKHITWCTGRAAARRTSKISNSCAGTTTATDTTTTPKPAPHKRLGLFAAPVRA